MLLELPKKLQNLQGMAYQVANEMLRQISRKYDLTKHEKQKKLEKEASKPAP